MGEKCALREMIQRIVERLLLARHHEIDVIVNDMSYCVFRIVLAHRPISASCFQSLRVKFPLVSVHTVSKCFVIYWDRRLLYPLEGSAIAEHCGTACLNVVETIPARRQEKHSFLADPCPPAGRPRSRGIHLAQAIFRQKRRIGRRACEAALHYRTLPISDLTWSCFDSLCFRAVTPFASADSNPKTSLKRS